MEMLATARSIQAAQAAVESRVSESEVDTLSEKTFLQHIPLSNFTNAVPFGLIAICCLYLPDWQMMAIALGLNVLAVATMFGVSRLLCRSENYLRTRTLWRVYEGLGFVSGVLWAGMMLPIIPTLGRNIASTFVCVVIIVSVAITCMVVASQWRTMLAFLAGVILCLTPQTVVYLNVVGPIPLAATLGLGPALLGLALTVRRQQRLMIRTQLENKHLADDLTHALAAAEFLANRDSLTGLYNRRAFEELADKVMADEAAGPLCLILVDLDHFKAINDRYGHAIGDSVLQQASQLIAGTVGPLDLVGRGDGAVARWGGEEFILLVRGCCEQQGAELAEQLRQGLAAQRHPEWPEGLIVTGSFGVAEWNRMAPLHLGISRADTAMYAAKHAGRNRVCRHSKERAAASETA